MNRVIFLLPSRGNVPVGGFKVAYEYGNRFAQAGYDTRFLYPLNLSTEKLGFIKIVRRLAKYLIILLKREYSCDSWFRLNALVREHFLLSFRFFRFRADDIVIATAGQTALFLIDLKGGPTQSNRLYLIQHWEDWIGLENLEKTWRSSLTKIVIAPWLSEIGKRYGQETVLIENGLDFDYFSCSESIEMRDPQSVSMLYHTSPLKGSKFGINALSLVKDRFPELQCKMFGVFPRPDGLPEWIEYFQKPDRITHNRIYNTTAIYLAPAVSEGFGLTPAEAMQCGCAVVATDNGGYAVTCKHLETAIVCPINDAQALADSVIGLIENDELRIKLADNGRRAVQRLTWERSFSRMLDLVNEKQAKTT